ncbi:hypothetical protein Tco_1231158 [Tanacetum coccineum]
MIMILKTIIMDPVMQCTTLPSHSESLKRFMFHFSWRSTRCYRLSHSEIVDIKKVAVRSSLRLPNNKCFPTVAASSLDESIFKTSCSIDNDKFMMKAQVHVSNSFAISDVQTLPQKNIIDKITHEVLVSMPKEILREIVSKLSRP